MATTMTSTAAALIRIRIPQLGFRGGGGDAGEAADFPAAAGCWPVVVSLFPGKSGISMFSLCNGKKALHRSYLRIRCRKVPYDLALCLLLLV